MENELVDRLLTVMGMDPCNLNNNCRHAELSLINPSQSHLTSHQLKNFRMWAKRASLQKSLGEKRILKTKKDLDMMFADITPICPLSSIAVEQVEELYKTLLWDTLENEENTWNVEQYLQSLHASDPSFDFRMAKNGENGAATAVVWQTGTMRGDFELFGCALHVDFMKRKFYSVEWLYISIIACDANGRCVA